MTDKVLTRPKFKDVSETGNSVSSSSNTLTLNLENGNIFWSTLTENITTFTLSNPPASGSVGAVTLILTQDGTGGRTVTWPASIKWAGEEAPIVTAAAGSVDFFSFITRNGGTTWYGFATQDLR